MSQLDRRGFLATAAATAATLAAPAFAQSVPDTVRTRSGLSGTTRRNTASFRTLDWSDYFGSLRRGAILVDIDSRALHMWQESGEYHLFPSSVPMSPELTRKGRTSVIRKVEGPSWSPTPNMRRRNPEWPAYVPPGPDNPLGTHALYLGWKYYRIHGTHDTRKIGRRSSSGCIGLYNEHIARVFEMTRIGTQVLLI
ncbi:putative L,D-transpeptidase ErfK/SrfK precursor [Jannaschia aquimarina]|uniref:ErfK_3 protein n=2 Tax=Jannaschia aquimarina TaxID=935700 RepID=A0A0D1D507_9RHOB|nr:L,D-transpeptidase family protein [Jannaschia aquimarina]KIT15128.1 putative L,D-transpeptidase ErfK/SrfK precursor [Jannaschia aquimarina]SNS64830.1 L,D-transpeptidase catalytic domain [Jannaschia aquimarina]